MEVLRGDLSRILHDASRATTEYLFGDTVTSLTETPAGVDVAFRHAPPRTFDVVIGADGLHSTVRRLAFGPEQQYVSHLGHYAATRSLPDDPHPTRPGSVDFNAPGRLASVAAAPATPGRAGAFSLFASPELSYDRNDPAAHKALITRAFAGLPWRVGSLLDSLAAAEDLYFDSISRADVGTWSTGRTALLGDAACGATIGGMGTGTAVVAAYVLAAELARTPEDPRTAFRRYESLVRPYARACRRGGNRTAPLPAPSTKRQQPKPPQPTANPTPKPHKSTGRLVFFRPPPLD
ncbi:hypothetical protein [Streptomyces lavendulae]|uniref:hypothetical protein n=1 Tax=Streptomyces lavendulae TaxID=1914 RepID=UPI00255257D9|nr:hypothetical protein [Streptomyces lavendulae]